jgi:hypothetical protein
VNTVAGNQKLKFGITFIVATELQIAMLPIALACPYRRKQRLSAMYDSGGTGGQYMAVLCLSTEIVGGAAYLHRHVMGLPLLVDIS